MFHLCIVLIELGDKVISTQIFDRKFVCDLNACKGVCCVAGDAGAPLKLDEVSIIEDAIDEIKPFMRQEGIDVVDAVGVFYMDQDNEPVTSLIEGAECAFVTFDDKGIAKCAIEEAHASGAIDFKKPISCHLYPIRVKKFNDFTALNYDQWDICAPACACGEKLDVPVYKFLKEPLIRAYGEEFFDELCIVDKELKDQK